MPRVPERTRHQTIRRTYVPLRASQLNGAQISDWVEHFPLAIIWRLLRRLKDASTSVVHLTRQVPGLVVQARRLPVEQLVHAVPVRHVPRELKEVEVQHEADLSKFLRDE